MNKPSRRIELVRAGLSRPPTEELRKLIADDEVPDVMALREELSLESLDERSFTAMPGLVGDLMRRLPLPLAQCVEVLRMRNDLELIISWSEALAFLVAVTLLPFRRRPAHVGIFMWVTKRKKAVPLRLLWRRFDGIVIPAPQQYRYAVEHLGIPPTLADQAIPWGVDARFWRPGAEQDGDMICCVGREMRDYPTLVEAIRPLDITCHIAAGGTQGLSNPWLQLTEQDLPPGVTLGRKSPRELRELYRRSRFVVVPLLPTDSDNGITTVLEAFAMRKAVICTNVPGQAGVLQQGVNCLLVPPGDIEAMRATIERLWSDIPLCHRLGAAGHALVEQNYTTQHWVASLRRVAERAMAARAARGPKRVSVPAAGE